MFDVLGRITELKEERGWTTYRVAKNAGIPQSSIQTWYAKGINPPFDAIEKMCNAFDVTLSEFFEEDIINVDETNLAIVRKQAAMSQEELAEKSEVPIKDVRAFDSGKRDIKKAPYYIVERLAKTLGCATEDIT